MHTYIVKYSKVYIHIYADIYIKFLSCFFVEGFLGKFYDNDLTLKESCADGHASKLLIQNCIKATFECCTEHSETFKFSQALTKHKTEAIAQDS